MTYVEEWSVMDREHYNYLSGLIEALKASTLRLPVVSGARVRSFIFPLLKLNLILLGTSGYLIFLSSGRYPGTAKCCWFSSRSDAGNGNLNMLFNIKGNCLLYFHY